MIVPDSVFAEHRARVLDALSRHSDPVLREIGTQIATGALAPHQMLQDPHYIDALHRHIRHLHDNGLTGAQDGHR
jgi:hypothetical protein